MAVTINSLAVELRIVAAADETLDAGLSEVLTRLLATCNGIINGRVVNASTLPEWARDEAVVRLAGYLYDKPNSTPGAGYANAFLNSGAESVLKPYLDIKSGVGAFVEAIGAATTLIGIMVSRADSAGSDDPNGVATFQSATNNYVATIKPSDSFAYIKITLPAGTVLSSVVDSVDGDITDDFSRVDGTQAWLTDDDYDDTARILFVVIRDGD